jgi:hypothetical protein
MVPGHAIQLLIDAIKANPPRTRGKRLTNAMAEVESWLATAYQQELELLEHLQRRIEIRANALAAERASVTGIYQVALGEIVEELKQRYRQRQSRTSKAKPPKDLTK